MHLLPFSSHGRPRPSSIFVLGVLLGLMVLASPPKKGVGAEYRIEQDATKVTVIRDGKLLTILHAQSGSKPVLYPVIGPGELPLTRAFPIEDAKATEKKDHIHHRSFWFTHGEVNGIDFWAEGEGKGKIFQRQVAVNQGGEKAVIETENDWVTADGDTILRDVRRFQFHDVLGDRAIDFAITLRASDQEVVFGDTKEGSFGVRVAGSMKVDANLGGKITSSTGHEDAKTWGLQASWVDYVGPVSESVDEESKPVAGIAILNHPSSFGYPTRWHVRTYGLFAANPFGVHHFTGGKPTEGVRLKPGGSLVLKYRVILHSGPTDNDHMNAHFKTYSEN